MNCHHQPEAGFLTNGAPFMRWVWGYPLKSTSISSTSSSCHPSFPVLHLVPLPLPERLKPCQRPSNEKSPGSLVPRPAARPSLRKKSSQLLIGTSKSLRKRKTQGELGSRANPDGVESGGVNQRQEGERKRRRRETETKRRRGNSSGEGCAGPET